VITGLQLAIRRDPGIEQAGDLQGGLDAGALTCARGRPELEHLPQRRAGAFGADAGVARVRRRRPGIYPAL
jgi:hypothetical protein